MIREGVAGSQLVGYYTGAAGAEAEAEQNQRLRAALQAELPEYMVPAQLMRLAQMPLARAASWIRGRCRSRSGSSASTSSRRPSCNGASQRSGAKCSACRGSACATISSNSAGIPCWPPASSRAHARPATSNCRCARCSRPANWRPSANRSAQPRPPDVPTATARSAASTASSRCRCPTRSSACGSSGNWSRTARPTTSAAWRA